MSVRCGLITCPAFQSVTCCSDIRTKLARPMTGARTESQNTILRQAVPTLVHTTCTYTDIMPKRRIVGVSFLLHIHPWVGVCVCVCASCADPPGGHRYCTIIHNVYMCALCTRCAIYGLFCTTVATAVLYYYFNIAAQVFLF